MSFCLGIDFSTNHIDGCLLDETTNQAVWHRWSPRGDTALDRLRHVPLVMPNFAFYDDCFLCALEIPYGRGQPGTQAKLNRVFGAICASIPASVELWACGQAEWKKELGLKGKPTFADLNAIAPGNLIESDGESSADAWQDGRDAYCIALWARTVNRRAIEAA